MEFDFSLIGVYEYIYDKIDKIGSDLFQIDTVRNFFVEETIGYVIERCKNAEATQTITDEIRTLVVPEKLDLHSDSFNPYLLMAALPKNYLRKLRVNCIKKNGHLSENPTSLNWAEYDNYKKNPLRKPDSDNPFILQREDLIMVDQGVDVEIDKLSLIYCKKPTFATLNTQEDRIVNLPDDSIFEIIDSTIFSLLNSIGDVRAAAKYQEKEAFKKINK